MTSHVVLIGYGDTGHTAAGVLRAGQAFSELVVVDSDPARVVLAARCGASAVLGGGAEAETLRSAGVCRAAQVIVTVSDDMSALRITAAVRRLNSSVKITTSVREGRWRELALCVGADQVLVTEQLVGRSLGLSVRRTRRCGQELQLDGELVIAQRRVRRPEVGLALAECDPLVLAVIRDGTRFWRDDKALGRLRPDDRLVALDVAG
ncbi:NAD(P)-binding protein [Lentzea sp. NPDC051838]|uniref:NAD(P)-binding protein n=1 Tax=Lentzea sp. NPDC051838 TaxID=3154849 RepID=UPI003432A457